jgi:hypothetical protein
VTGNKGRTEEPEFEILEIVGLDDEELHAPEDMARTPCPPPLAEPVDDPPLAAMRHRGQLEGIRQVLGELLGPLDALEMCIREDPHPEALRRAVRLALRGLWDVFRRHDLERIEGDGVPFDPREHEAVDTVPSDRVPPGTVLSVLRVGYRLGGELARPALVRVSAPVEGRRE